MTRYYSRPALDGTAQYTTEAAHWQDNGETIDTTDTQACERTGIVDTECVM